MFRAAWRRRPAGRTGGRWARSFARRRAGEPRGAGVSNSSFAPAKNCSIQRQIHPVFTLECGIDWLWGDDEQAFGGDFFGSEEKGLNGAGPRAHQVPEI